MFWKSYFPVFENVAHMESVDILGIGYITRQDVFKYLRWLKHLRSELMLDVRNGLMQTRAAPW